MFRQILTLPGWLVALCLVASNLLGAEADWLTKHVPPVFEGGTPFTIKKVSVSRNHVDQEVLRADYTRTPEIIRTLPKEIKLVILPVGGGRFETWVNAGIAASPAQSGKIDGITDSLLDYRGIIPGGARAYLEMIAANAVKAQPPVRISNVFWIGTDAQLQVAQKTNPVDPGDADRKAVVTKSVSDDAVLPAGMPVRYSGGTQWFNGMVLEKSGADGPLKLVVYFARPGGLYLPWYVTADRSDVKVETAALSAAAKDATWFADHLREVKGRIGQGSVPFTLKAIGEKVVKGDRVVWFGFHGLMGGEALEDAKDGKVKVRDARFKQESVLEAKQLYVDPETAN